MSTQLTKIKPWIIIGLLVVVATFIILFQRSQKLDEIPEGLIQANGRVEGESVIISSQQPGRIIEIRSREGDSISKGELLIRLDDRILKSRVDQAIAAAEAAKARTEQCQADFTLMGKEVPLLIDTSEADVDAAEAILLQAQAGKTQSQRDYERFLELGRGGYTSTENTERANTKWGMAKDQVNVADAALKAAQLKLLSSNLGPDRLASKKAQVLAFRAAELEAIARVEEAKAAWDELTIISPSSGTITTRFVEPGELVNVGAPLMELINLDELHLKVFIPESQIGKVHIGLEARVYTDAFPDKPFNAEVRHIASRAEFTPKEVQTPDERVKLVYAVKLAIKDNPDHQLTPGLPADAMIRWLPEVTWIKPQW